MPKRCLKIKHYSKVSALIALSSTARKDRAEKRVYRCPQCNTWHLTSKRK